MNQKVKELKEWILERSKRGLVGGYSSDPFHQRLSKFSKEAFDGLLAELKDPREENQRLASIVGGILRMTPPLNGHQALWFYFGGHAKRLLVESLVVGEGLEKWRWWLLFVDLNGLRVAVPHPALELIAKAHYQAGFRPLEQLDRDVRAVDGKPWSGNKPESRSSGGKSKCERL
jgi:hypothetical protein